MHMSRMLKKCATWAAPVSQEDFLYTRGPADWYFWESWTFWGKFLLIFVRTNLQSQIWAQTGGFRYGLCLSKKVGRRLIQKIKLETFSQKSPLARKILLLIFVVGRRSDKKKGRVKISTTHISSNNSLCVRYCRNLWRRIIFTLQVWHSSDSYNIQEKHSR